MIILKVLRLINFLCFGIDFNVYIFATWKKTDLTAIKI